ncbi:MAG: signal peptide peptidase SppA [Flavobacteriaceae bacterium]|tara:strand:+ start:2747 stop:4507 length:1761 start_codon:yes stop_codon:yes gene_type:complete
MNFARSFLAALLGSLTSFLILLIFFLIFISGIASIASLENQISFIKENSILKLDLNKPVNERASIYQEFESLLGLDEEILGLNNIIESINIAKENENIKGIELKCDFPLTGWAQTRAIRETLKDFKKSGKFIYAYSDVFTQKGYYLASIADTIGVNPEGTVEFKGLSSEVLYYKDFQDKYGIKMEVIRHGKYKSAVEPYLENKMSSNNRKQIKELIESIWETISDEISQSRKVNNSKINQIAENLDANTPQKAFNSNLIDLIIYQDQMDSIIKKSIGFEYEKDLNKIGVKKIIASQKNYNNKIKDRIAVLYATGTILYGEGSENIIGQGLFVDAFEKISNDDWIKAIVVRIDSPGGVALTSDIILRSLKLAKTKKPVIVSMGNVAASGGYYIASGADKIYADPLSITGSIGVFASLPNISGFSKKIGLNSEQVSTHKNSMGYSIYKPLQPGFIKSTKESIKKVYESFKLKVAEGRNLTLDEVESIAQGRVWSGKQALNIGLIDSLGDLNAAINGAAKLAEINEFNIIEYPKRKASFESLIQDFSISLKDNKIENKIPDFIKLITEQRNIQSSKNIQALIPFDLNIY